MKYFIRISPKLEEEFSKDGLEVFCTHIMKVIGELSNCGNASYTITYPTTEHLQKKQYWYTISVTVESDQAIASTQLFNELNSYQPLTLVCVQDYKYTHLGADEGVYWTNDGATTYHDGGTYYDPIYEFHVNGSNHYDVIYVPDYIRNTNDRAKERYKGMTYMWRCTGSWDNPLKATTLEEALHEFEDYYYDRLWKSVKANQKDLEEATDKFRNFAEYLMRTRGAKK